MVGALQLCLVMLIIRWCLPLALFACAPPSSGKVEAGDSGSDTDTSEAVTSPKPWLTDDRYVLLNTHEVIVTEVGNESGGTTLVSGVDLDHDGVLEWAAAAPRSDTYPYSSQTKISVFEGNTLVAERTKDEYGSGAYLLGAGDVSGDGFPDLLWRACLGNIQCRLQITQGVAPETDASLAMNPPGTDYASQPMALDTLPGSATTLVAWWLPSVGITHGPVPVDPSTDEEPNAVSWADALLDNRIPESEDATDATHIATVHLIPEPDQGRAHFLLGTFGGWDDASGRVIAHLRICPLRAGIDLQTDCPPLPADEPIGRKALAADLDGDGVSELIGATEAERYNPGALWIFERDGTWRATVRGIDTHQLGGHLAFVVDDDGERWLLAGDRQPFDTVYAFRSSGLHGELTTDDADRFYVDPDGTELHNMAPYRETEDGPLWLLVGTSSAVYRRPFEP